MISLQASDIFFCIRYDYLQGQNSAASLFKGPMFCTQYAFLPAFLRFVQNVWKANAGIFFLVYSACMNFFHLIFPDHVYFVHPSTDISVNMSTDTRPTWRSTYRPTLGRYVGRRIDRHSADMSTEICRSTYRPICRYVDMSTDMSVAYQSIRRPTLVR